MWVAIVISVLSLVIAYSQAPRTPETVIEPIKEVDVSTAEEGVPMSVVFGTRVLKNTNVIWYGDLRYKKVQTEGGK